jgi:alpha-tubulin suppressor-like RCC1 family protein
MRGVPRRPFRLVALGVALALWVCVARATVVPLSGFLAVRGGAGSNIALRSGGTVWSWGDNSVGQLGDGTTTPSLTPIQVVCGEAAGDPDHCSADGHLKNAVKVAAGNLAAMVLLDDGRVLNWGINSRFNNAANAITPAFVACGAADAGHCTGGRITGATQIAQGFSHGLVLLDDGAVLAWGTNNNGNLGNNQPGVPSALPVQVSGLVSGSGVVAITAGSNHSFALKSDGTVLGWGVNGGGQLGDDSTTLRAVPVPVLCRPDDLPGSTFCSNGNVLQGVVAVSASNAISIALMADQTLLAWGGNTSGQVGDGTTTQRKRPVNVCAVGATAPCQVANGNILQGVANLAVSSLSAAGYALMPDGSLLAWGNNGNGQLGDGTTSSRSTPVLVTGLGAGSGVVAISAGDAHAVALISDGTARAWGSNGNGQLGNGAISAKTTPVATSGLGSGSGVIAVASRAQFTLALRSDGTVVAWGSNANGQLGDGTTDNRNAPISVACRTVDAPGSAFCSSDGRLQGVVAIATGNNYSLALLGDGSVVAWGINGSGQLGDGTTIQRNRPVSVCNVGAVAPCLPANGNILFDVTGIAGANTTSFARTVAGGVVSWGNNPNGLLGVGNALPTSSSTPLNVVCRAGDPLATAFCSPSGHLLGVSTINAASNAPAAVMNDGTVLTWGLNLVNQLGDGTAVNRNRPVNVCAVGATAPCTVADGNVLQGIIATAGSGNGSFALTATGFVLGWGVNNAGTIGDSTTTNRAAPVHVCAPGASAPCDVANGNVLQSVLNLGAGGTSAYAVLTDGTALSWGTNSSGQLGDGTLISRLTPVPVSGLGPGSGVISMSGGAGFAVALKADGAVVAWGANGAGELGDGTVYTADLTPAPVVFDDVTPPTLTFGAPVPGAPNGEGGWYITDVAIPWVGADAHSALDHATNPTSPLVLSAEGAAVNGSVSICDIAENCATFGSPSVKIDKTAPQVTVTATPNQLWPPDKKQVPVLILVTANDNLGLPSQPISALTISSNAPGSAPFVIQPNVFLLDSGSTTSGSAGTTIQLIAEVGLHGETRVYTVTGTVKDAAGHSTPFSIAVTVERPQ